MGKYIRILYAFVVLVKHESITKRQSERIMFVRVYRINQIEEPCLSDSAIKTRDVERDIALMLPPWYSIFCRITALMSIKC